LAFKRNNFTDKTENQTILVNYETIKLFDTWHHLYLALELDCSCHCVYILEIYHHPLPCTTTKATLNQYLQFHNGSA